MQAQSVTLDFLKPVGTVVDLSDKFNARVGDSMTPFNLFVTEGGKPKALNGLHPELEAAVGDGELKDGKAVMSDNAKGIHWVGNADNVTGYNRLTLTLPAEVFPQSGFCYGHLILANDAGVRESSVDIWFKVLDGLEIMGLAADYYDSAIELELKKLKEANSQAEQRLSKMKATPEAFANLDDLKAKYPVGNSNLNVTVDDGHLWIWLNGGWRDCGQFQTASLGFFNQLPGINLIDGTSTDAQHVGPGIYGKDSNVIDVSRRLDSNLTWSFSIKNLTGNVFVKVKYMDQVGDFLNLDGSINNDAQFGTATGYVVKSGTNVTHFTIPANATSMVVTLACDTKSEFDIANSMLTYGTCQMPWKPSLKDSTDPARQIAQMIANLDDLLNAKKVDVAANTHLNLLHISPNTWTHAVGSHDSDWVNWDPQTYGNLLTYAVKLKHINSANDHGVYFTIRMIDSVGTPIDLSGKEISTAYTNVVVSPDSIKTNTDYVKTIALPANAVRVSMTITTADTNDSYDYCDETIIAGSRADMPLENFDNDDNLIPNTHAWESHIGPGLYAKQTDWFDVTGGQTLHWSITIANATDSFHPAIILKDSKGNQINLDGTAGDNRLIASPLGNQDYTATAQKQFVWNVNLPSNAAEASLVVQFKSDKLEMDYCNEIANYASAQEWKPRLSDLSKNEQIAQMIANLDDLLNAKKVDVAANTHLNLLHISPNTWTHAVGSHDSDWVNWDPQTYGNLLTYAVKLKHINSANDHGVYFTIRMIDSVGTPIDLSGKEISTAYTNVVVSPDNIKTNTDYVKTIALPANAARVSMTITTADTSDSYDYCDETIIAGSIADMPLENFDNGDNLIPNTHAWESHIGPGLYAKQTDWFDVTGGQTLHWSITIANATDSFYPAIILKDSKGNQINLDGTAGDNRLFASPLGNQDYTATAQKQFVWNVNLPSNAAEASLVVQFKSNKLEMDYCNEIANYASVQEWKPKLSDLSKNEQIERLLEENNSGTASTSTSMNLATINLIGDTDKLLAKNQEVTLQFSLQQPCQNIKGYVKMQWQGNSSLGWAKKGFKLKTYQDASCTKKLSFRPKPSFYKSNKWHLKGYMTDRYTVRDSTAAEIYTNFIANNPTAPAQLLSANHYGTIQSMPVLLYMNDKFYGLMELNTKSGGELWNIADDDDTAMALESNGGINSNWTTQNGVLNGADYEVQAGSGKNGQALLGRIGKLAAGMSDADFVKNFEQYINLNSALDYVIFNYWINNDDSWGSKNIVYLTYDGIQTYLMPYDFDSTMMAGWVPGKQIPIDEDYFSDNAFLKNNLIKKIITLMPDKLLKRFNELNSLGVLDVAQAARLFRDKVNEIGSGAYSLDAGKWEAQAPDAYSDKAPSIDQICYMFIKRKQLLNDKLKDQVSKL